MYDWPVKPICSSIFQECAEKGVRMMIDAEQTYIQAALGWLVLVLQAKYNHGEPVVYNTYQCYRKVSNKKRVVIAF